MLISPNQVNLFLKSKPLWGISKGISDQSCSCKMHFFFQNMTDLNYIQNYEWKVNLIFRLQIPNSYLFPLLLILYSHPFSFFYSTTNFSPGSFFLFKQPNFIYLSVTFPHQVPVGILCSFYTGPRGPVNTSVTTLYFSRDMALLSAKHGVPFPYPFLKH